MKKLNVFQAVGTAFVLSLFVSLLIGANPILGLVSIMAVGKFELAYSFMRGHGTGVRKVPMIGKTPILAAFFWAAALGICGFLLGVSFQASDELLPQTIANVQAFAIAATLGCVVSIVRWYFGAYWETYAGSRYEAMSQFMAKGMTPEEAQRRAKEVSTHCTTNMQIGNDGTLRGQNVFGDDVEV